MDMTTFLFKNRVSSLLQNGGRMKEISHFAGGHFDIPMMNRLNSQAKKPYSNASVSQ